MDKQLFKADEWDSKDFTWTEQTLKPGFRRPVIVHRAVLGSVERFMAILIEHLGGKWPFWISPRQIIVCPISEAALEYCESVQLYFHKLGYECEVDRTQGSINKKVRNAQLAQWNYILCAGKDEMAEGSVDVRSRDNKRHGKMRPDDFVEFLKKEIPQVSSQAVNMYEKAWSPDSYARAGGEESKQAAKGSSKASSSAGSQSVVKRNFTADLEEIEAALADGNQFILGGIKPSAADSKMLEKIKNVKPDPLVYPHAFGWWAQISKFSPEEQQSWK